MKGLNQNIVLLTPSLVRAGQEKVVYELAVGFKAKNLNVEVVAFNDGPYRVLLENLKIPVILLSSVNKYSKIFLIKSFFNLIKSKNSYSFVFHGLGFEKIWLFFCFLNFNMPKSFFVFHNNYPFLTDEKFKYQKYFMRQFLKKITSYIFIKKSIQELALESKIINRIKNSFVIENGISTPLKLIDNIKLLELRAKLDISPSDFVIIQVGRFVSQKNQLMSIMSVELLKEKIPNIKLIFAGKGPLLRECQNYVESNNLQQNIIILGNIPNIDQYLNISNLFIMPSFFEGHPISLIEAIMLKVPSIVFDSPGINNFFPNKFDCLHYSDDKNHISLSKIIHKVYKELINNNYNFSKLEYCSGWCCDNYSSDKMISSYLNVLNNKVNEK